MTDNYVVQPLTIDPFVEISRVDDYGQHPQPIGIDPPLACPPTAARFAKDRSKMALVYDVRIEELPGIGNPNQPPPPAGIKIISGDDRFILFGGDASHTPVLFRRGSPTYLRFPTGMTMPAFPTFFAVGAFSHNGDVLAVVRSNALTTVELYEYSGSAFTLTHSATVGFNVETLEFSHADRYVIAKSDSDFELILKATFASESSPTGALLAMNDDEDRIVVDDGNPSNLLTVYLRTGCAWASAGGVPNTAGSQRTAAFSPDGLVLEVSALNGSSAYSPMFLAVVRGSYRLIKDGLHGVLSTYQLGESHFSKDGEVMARAIAPSAGTGEVGIFERTTANMSFFDYVPVTTTATQGSFIDQTRDGTYLAVGDGSATQILKWDGDSFEPLTSIATYGCLAKWSPNGIYLVVAPLNSSATNARIYKRTGDTLAFLTEIDVTSVPLTAEAQWTDDSNFLVINTGAAAATGLRCFTRSGDTFTLYNLTNIPTTNTKTSVSVSGDGNWLALLYGNGLRIWKKDGSGVFQTTQNPGVATGSRRVRLSSDGLHMAIAFNVSPFFTWYKRTADLFSTVSAPVVGVGIESFEFSGDGTKVAFGTTESSGRVLVYDLSGETFTFRFESPQTTSGTVARLSFTTDGKSVVASTAASPFAYCFTETVVEEIPTYQPRHTVPLSTLPTVRGFSPDGAILHFEAGGTAHHISPADPWGEIAPLPFAKTADPATVSGVTYSNTGKVVWWVGNGGSFEITVTNGRGQKVELNRLDGTFVGLYELGGSMFHEMDFAVHDRGTEISNIVFADSAAAMSYFAFAEAVPSSTTQGRFIYATTAFLDLLGQEWDANMQASYLAFNPQEDHFAATYKRLGGAHDIVLYSFTGTDYMQRDTDLVAFGPVDFSSCADITVAHGGNPNPFTLYKVIAEELVRQVLPDMDWSHTGVILNVSFLDCDKMVVITPEEVIVVDKDPEDGLTEEDAVPRDDEGDGDTIEVDETTETIRIPPVKGIGGGEGGYGIGGGGGGGGWTPGGITPLTYIPYCSVCVFYRE